MDERERLARFQAEVLERLDSGESVEAVARGLSQLGDETELPGWEGLDPRMLATAMELMRKWGVHRETKRTK